MLTGLLAVVAKTPMWLKTALVVGAVFLGVQVKHSRDMKRVNAQLTEMTQQLRVEQLYSSQLQVSITNQNAAIRRLSQQQKQFAAESATRAIRVLNEEKAESAELKSPQTKVPVGPAGMNGWIADQFKAVK